MTRLYQSVYRSTAKDEAQAQLAGKTHYVDSNTLKFHKSRIVDCEIVSCGLLFWIIESCALDMNNTKRGFRYVVFDVFGNVVSRVDLDGCFTTSKKARIACCEYLATVNALAITKAAIKEQKKRTDKEFSYLEEQIKKIA